MSRTTTQWRAGLASDVGRQRTSNEDRALADEANGVFLVVDGMGGHAAGEKAAQIAVETIPQELERLRGETEPRIRQAITTANNEIFNLARERPELTGMACVLTLAVAHGDKLTVGHVGDSRLYLAWTGRLRKLTSDHSPVGEKEDRGDLTEEEAMHDPRRNVVFRDVGSRPHAPADDEFIETRSYPFRPDAAFLLCTDGLSDVLTSAEMNAVVQRYDGDPQRVVDELVDAANEAGGKDNISAVFVAGPEFVGTEVRPSMEARSRHSITRMRRGGRWKRVLGACLWMLIGIVLGAAGWTQVEKYLPAPSVAPAVTAEPPVVVRVNASDPRALRTAIVSARPGDVIEVPKGAFLGPLELKDGVSVVSEAPGESVIRLEGVAPGAVAVAARNINGARLSGFRIEGGLLIQGAAVDIVDDDITGATDCGVHIEGGAGTTLRANFIHENAGCGVLIEGGASPRLTGNRIARNGTEKRPVRAGVEIYLPSLPALLNNMFEGNGPAIAGDIPPQTIAKLLRANIVIGTGQGASR
jgi:serine/threonine protein phosphatase PrpC